MESHWQLITDKKFPENEDIILTDGKYIYIGEYLFENLDDGYPIFSTCDECRSKMTHWMPCPKLP